MTNCLNLSYLETLLLLCFFTQSVIPINYIFFRRMDENETIDLVKHIQSLWKDETFCDVEYRFVSQKSKVGTSIGLMD